MGLNELKREPNDINVSTFWNINTSASVGLSSLEYESVPLYLPGPCDLKSSVDGAGIYKLGDTRKRCKVNQLKLNTDVG